MTQVHIQANRHGAGVSQARVTSVVTGVMLDLWRTNISSSKKKAPWGG